jgi:mono/diheme cytochrome c family protein
LKAFILGAIVAVLLLGGSFITYFAAGIAPVATAAPPMPFEKTIARMALNARLEKEMPKTVPIQPDEANLVSGARIYVENCSVCHGLPGEKPSAISEGMFPKPPQMFKGKGVTDDPPGETYWKAANGIRMTGMPAFKGPLSENQLWQVSLLLANADKISPAVQAALTLPTAAPPAPQIPAK